MSPEERTLRIERVFAAPLVVTFDAWTSVDVLRRWWPAGAGWDTPVAEVEPVVGGRLRLVMRDPDGAEFGGEGRYLELDRPHRLVFSWRWDSRDLGVQLQRVEVVAQERPFGPTITTEQGEQILSFLGGIGIGSILFAPLGAGPECLGNLVLTRTSRADDWTEVETTIALDIGTPVSIAVMAMAPATRAIADRLM